mmetsp:Transcript_30377/g.66780  ORF Transcript_30377/g.66780 Transcript_30377/m.66780 type:complete len:149 (+) Transcript_30377:189-635(+)
MTLSDAETSAAAADGATVTPQASKGASKKRAGADSTGANNETPSIPRNVPAIAYDTSIDVGLQATMYRMGIEDIGDQHEIFKAYLITGPDDLFLIEKGSVTGNKTLSENRQPWLRRRRKRSSRAHPTSAPFPLTSYSSRIGWTTPWSP